jgi:L-fuconate dehydratase
MSSASVTTITKLTVKDVRFPTSKDLDGSDAMSPDPDYSAAYVIIHTDNPSHEGHGFSFTTGRGTEIVCVAIKSHEHLLIGHTLEEFISNPGAFWRHLTSDSQLRWIGPEKGALHLALGAIVNALWDLYAKSEGKPLWRLISDFTTEQFVKCIDFRYITDVVTPDEALKMLKELEPTKSERIQQLEEQGYPAYTTSAGWLGYSDEKIRRLCREAINEGFTHLKIKVGRDLEDDIRRITIIREEVGYDRRVMVDANQVWDVDQAIQWMKQLVQFQPYWIEEPTSPDDVLGHARISKELKQYNIGVATGEHGMNRVLFKQMLQANALQFCQIDSCRLGGVNEVLAVLLLAAKFGVPVCPHAGGVGLCELVQHLSMIDFVVVSGTWENRITEYVDHLHEHFEDPCIIKNGRYVVPTKPGYSTQMKQDSQQQYSFPDGPIWKTNA